MKHKGRGAVSNPVGRFERFEYVPLEEREDIETVVLADASRSILAKNDSPDVPFSVSVNPYRGCEHGCVYCFARPTHAYLGLSPGLDFETRIFSKPRAAELLRKEFRKPGYQCEPIALGANTDPYQPAERQLGITRALLETFEESSHPVSIVTKSHLVLRDIDLIASLAESGLANVFVSLTSLQPELARRMEPRASTPEKRLEAIAGLSSAGIPVGLLASPMIPALNDAELEVILAEGAAAGASSARYILLRLPLELKDIFREWLEAYYPTKASHVLNLVRDMRGGALYRARFGERMKGSGPYAELLEQRFRAAARKYDLEKPLPALRTSEFRPPSPRDGQMTLFD